MLWLLDIDIDGVDEVLHFVDNNENIVYAYESTIDPVANWKLDDDAASKTILDSSGNNYHGEAQQNTEDISVEGQFDNALSFNGSSDYIDIENAIEGVEDNTEGTIALWFKKDTISAKEMLISFDQAVYYAYHIEIYLGADGKIYVEIFDSYYGNAIGFHSPGATTYDDNAWHHIAVTMDSAGSKMYIDGSIVTPVYDTGSSSDVEWFADIVGNLESATIGKDVYGDAFEGILDSVFIYDIAMTADQIEQLYDIDEVVEIISNTYHKNNFILGKYDNADTKLPERELQITNADLVNYLLPYVEDYNGLIGSTIVATPVNSQHLDLDMSSLSCEFIVKDCSVSDKYIILTLGMPNPLNQRFPLDKYFANQCRYYSRFKGIECGYSGEETECNGTPSRCAELGNLARFGGQPGLRAKTVKFV
jgi:hypothetical protein